MSSSSIGGAIRQVIVDADLDGISYRVYRDTAPPEVSFPYVTFFDEIGNTVGMMGDANVITRKRMVQVSLWQARASEDVTLIDSLYAVLEKANLDANKRVFRCRVSSIERISNLTDNIIQHAITLMITQGV